MLRTLNTRYVSNRWYIVGTNPQVLTGEKIWNNEASLRGLALPRKDDNSCT